MSNFKIIILSILVILVLVIASNYIERRYIWIPSKKCSPHFVVTEMVQCKGNICNAVLEMDDIAILVPYDSTKVHVGDTLYITK